PNRTALLDAIGPALDGAREHDTVVGLLYLDVDRFKAFNDSRGHTIGDLILRSIGSRIRGAIRGSDLVARVGGDEFVVLLSDMRSSTEADTVARRILDSLEIPINVERRS